jgi:hypothetical protein
MDCFVLPHFARIPRNDGGSVFWLLRYLISRNDKAIIFFNGGLLRCTRNDGRQIFFYILDLRILSQKLQIAFVDPAS